MVLSLLGGSLGILAASWGVDALLALAPAALPRLHDVALNLPVAAFSLFLTVSVGILLGVFSAYRSLREDLRVHLAEGGPRQSGSLGAYRLGRIIIAWQLAAAMVLLVGAGLLGRSLSSVLAVNPGFRTEHTLTMDLALPAMEQDPASSARRVTLVSQIFGRLGAIPGVESLGGTNCLPMSSSLADGTYLLVGASEVLPASIEELGKRFGDSARTGQGVRCVVGQDFFQTLGIPVLRGRAFDQRDAIDAPQAAVISESLAKEKWPDEDPLGRKIEFGNMDGDLRLLTVVGVVGDIHLESLEQAPRPTIYLDYRQRPRAADAFTVVLRSSGEPGGACCPCSTSGTGS